MRIFPGNNGHFISFLAKVDFFNDAHVGSHSSCRATVLPRGGLAPAHGFAPRLLVLRPFPGKIRHFPSSTAKVVFFLAAHVRCRCSCLTIALAMRGLLFAHGRAPRILSLQPHANISRKQWAFHKFPAKSRLFPCCTRPLSLSLLNDSTGCRRTAGCACTCTPPSPLAPISGNHWAFTMFHGRCRLLPCCTRSL